jgi:hypothetical protein
LAESLANVGYFVAATDLPQVGQKYTRVRSPSERRVIVTNQAAQMGGLGGILSGGITPRRIGGTRATR